MYGGHLGLWRDNSFKITNLKTYRHRCDPGTKNVDKCWSRILAVIIFFIILTVERKTHKIVTKMSSRCDVTAKNHYVYKGKNTNAKKVFDPARDVCFVIYLFKSC